MKLREKKMLELLALKKMSRTDAAIVIGVSPGHFRNVLKGRKKLGIKYSKKLIEFFGADLMFNAIDWEAMKIKNTFAVGNR